MSIRNFTDYPQYTHGQILRHVHFNDTAFYFVRSDERHGKILTCRYQSPDGTFTTVELDFHEVEPHPDHPKLEIIPIREGYSKL